MGRWSGDPPPLPPPDSRKGKQVCETNLRDSQWENVSWLGQSSGLTWGRHNIISIIYIFILWIQNFPSCGAGTSDQGRSLGDTKCFHPSLPSPAVRADTWEKYNYKGSLFVTLNTTQDDGTWPWERFFRKSFSMMASLMMVLERKSLLCLGMLTSLETARLWPDTPCFLLLTMAERPADSWMELRRWSSPWDMRLLACCRTLWNRMITINQLLESHEKYDGVQSNVQLITLSRPRIQENYLEMIWRVPGYNFVEIVVKVSFRLLLMKTWNDLLLLEQ